MSYEGRVQIITEKGRLHTLNDSGSNNYQPRSDDVWINHIDDTNCNEVGEIPIEILNEFYLIQEAKYQVCDLGHNHCIFPAIYRIPGPESNYLKHYNEKAYITNHTDKISYWQNRWIPLDSKEFNKLNLRRQAGEVFGTLPKT